MLDAAGKRSGCCLRSQGIVVVGERTVIGSVPYQRGPLRWATNNKRKIALAIR